MAKRRIKSQLARWFIAKEVVLGILALLSVTLVFYEWLGQPSAEQRLVLNRLDFAVAWVFLFDFALELGLTKNKKRYLKHNWYFLLAAIPITDGFAEALRGLRVLRWLRIIRAGEHLDFSRRAD